MHLILSRSVIPLAVACLPLSWAGGQAIDQTRIAFAQASSEPTQSFETRAESVARPKTVLAAGGILALGVSGAWLTYAYHNCTEWDFVCALTPLLTQPLAAPIGVHLANGSKGRLAPAIGRSYMMALLGSLIGGTFAPEYADAWPLMVAVTGTAQLLVSIAVERRTASERGSSP